jgi:hypothetical protein
MSVNIKQNADGGLGLEGKDSGLGSLPLGTVNYNVPVATTAQLLFDTSRAMVLDALIGRPFVIGTGGAATAAVWMAPSGTAPIAGTALHSGTYNLVGTIHTEQSLTLTTTQIPANYAVWVVYTGVATSAIGGITALGRPA